MAALLPILQEILPMLMPGSVHITKAEELQGPPPDAVDVDEENGHENDDAEAEANGGEAAVGGDDEDEPSHERDETNVDGETTDTVAAGASTARSRAIDDGEGPVPAELTRRPAQPEEPKRIPPRPRTRRLPHNGVSLRDAIVHKSGSLCASVLTVKPQCATVVFHNGEQEAILYAVSGTAVLATLPDDFDEFGDEFGDDGASTLSSPFASHGPRKGPEPKTTTVSAGDFVFMPAWTEHQVRNEGVPRADGTPADDVVWVVVRNAGEPTVVPLQGWGGEQAE